MKKGDKKKQQKAFKRRSQSKQARKRERLASPATSRLRTILQARNYPIEGCWTQEGWDQNGLAVVAVARRQPNDNIVFGVYLVDYYCLGLKDTYFNADILPGQFQHEYLPKIFRHTGMPMSITPALAHEIVYGAIEYARQFGFRPHSDFKRGQYILDPPETHPRTSIEFGKDGKPLYIAGPYDNTNAITRQLASAAGEGNYNYLVPLDGPPGDVSLDDLDIVWEEDYDDEDGDEG